MIVVFLGIVKFGYVYLLIEEYIFKECILLIFWVVKLFMVISIGNWIEDIFFVFVVIKEEF